MKKAGFAAIFFLTVLGFFWLLKPNNPRGLASNPSPPPPGVAPAENEHAGSLDYVACFAKGQVTVRDESLKKALFQIDPFDPVKPFQGLDNIKQTLVIKGEPVTFARAQFPDVEDEENDVGWIAEKFLVLKSECKIAEEYSGENTPDENAANDAKGLSDPFCCTYPLKKPTDSYLNGMAVFGYVRNKGKRRHAACDLYQNKNSPVVAIREGKVIRNLYRFYQGTYAIEVKHKGGFVVRYGEITGKAIKGIAEGKEVDEGKQIGYMGKVKSRCCEPMLHFELYSGKSEGSLNSKGKYKRRSDLLNPTQHLEDWREKTFHDSP